MQTPKRAGVWWPTHLETQDSKIKGLALGSEGTYRGSQSVPFSSLHCISPEVPDILGNCTIWLI